MVVTVFRCRAAHTGDTLTDYHPLADRYACCSAVRHVHIDPALVASLSMTVRRTLTRAS